jgi:hypothetical protein
MNYKCQKAEEDELSVQVSALFSTQTFLAHATANTTEMTAAIDESAQLFI